MVIDFQNTVELQLLEHRWLLCYGLFELIFVSLRNFSDSSRKQILREIFLFYYEIVCCVYSLESPHRGDSNEYTQHTIILLKIENISINYRHLLPDLAPWLNLICSNYTSLEQISMVQKISSHWSLTVTRMGSVVPKNINMICTVVKHGETFYGHHIALKTSYSVA